MKNSFSLPLIFALLFCEPLLHAQGMPISYAPEGPPPIDDWLVPTEDPPYVVPPVFTIGGISYSAGNARFINSSRRVRFSMPSVAGATVTQNITMERQVTGGIIDQPGTFVTSWAYPVGALKSGGYVMVFRADYPTGSNIPFASRPFGVPEEFTSLLQVNPINRSSLQVTGIPIAVYVLERSTNLIDWTAKATNQVQNQAFALDQTTFTNLQTVTLEFPLGEQAGANAWFYRVQIRPGEITSRVNFPGFP